MKTQTMKKSTIRRALVVALGFMIAALATVPASAQQIFDFPVKNCTQQNCGGTFLNGISQKNNTGDSIPFTVQVFADVGDCLRLDVDWENDDMKTVVVSPSGATWRNDDRSVDDFRPLVTALADVKGYYTVHINHWNGNQPLNSVQLFGLAYGRYVPGTPTNCPSPTRAFFAAPTSKGN